MPATGDQSPKRPVDRCYRINVKGLWVISFGERDDVRLAYRDRIRELVALTGRSLSTSRDRWNAWRRWLGPPRHYFEPAHLSTTGRAGRRFWPLPDRNACIGKEKVKSGRGRCRHEI